MPVCRLNRIVAVFLLLCGVQSIAWAQNDEVSVSAQVARDRVFVGDTVLFQVVVDNSRTPEPPQMPAAEGLAFDFRGGFDRSSSFVQIINGRREERSTIQYVFQYGLTATAPGSRTIPPITVRVEGETYTTEPVRVRVVEPEVSDTSPLEVTIDDDTLFTGQSANLTIRWIITESVSDLTFAASRMPTGIDIAPELDPRASRDRRRFITIDLFGQQASGEIRNETIDGQRLQTLTLRAVVTAREPGVFELGPIVVAYDGSSGRRGERPTRSISRSDPITVRVVDPPAEGRPPGFTGLIGSYDLDASASVDAVNLGDPIELRVRILGDEPMRGVTDGPDLDADPAFADFRRSPDGWRFQPTGVAGERVYTTTIRPTSPEITRIPSIKLPFFSAVTGEYSVATSDPIPLEVRRVREVTSADAIGVTSGGAVVKRLKLEPAGPGIWANELNPGVIASTRFDWAEQIRSPAWLAVLLGPPVLLLALLAVQAIRRRGPTRRAVVRRALHAAIRAHRRRGDGAAVRTLVAGIADAHPGSITAVDVERTLRPIDENLRRRLVELCRGTESARFAAATQHHDQRSPETPVLLRRATKQILGLADASKEVTPS